MRQGGADSEKKACSALGTARFSFSDMVNAPAPAPPEKVGVQALSRRAYASSDGFKRMSLEGMGRRPSAAARASP